MQESNNENLVLGWLVENYHYLRSAPTHVSQALSSCPDQVLGGLLTAHLRDEADHANLIAARISKARPDLTLSVLRPLPSTLAFVGTLVDLARGDWRAYLLSIVYLQRTLEPTASRHERFYDRVELSNPEIAEALRGMREHDDIDRALDHAGAADDLLALLVRRWPPDLRTVRRAATIPNLARGFLDGVLRFYGVRQGLPACRIGWSVK